MLGLLVGATWLDAELLPPSLCCLLSLLLVEMLMLTTGLGRAGRYEAPGGEGVAVGGRGALRARLLRRRTPAACSDWRLLCAVGGC